MSLKILLVTPYFPPMINGPALYIYNLAKGLVEKGVHVSVHTMEFPEVQQLPKALRKRLDMEGCEVRHFRYILDPRKSSHDQPISLFYILETIKRSDFFNIVHIHDFPKISNDLLILALKKLRPYIPVVLTPHGAGAPAPAHKLSSKLYWSTGIPWKVLHVVDHVVAVSPLQGRIFARLLGPKKVSTILTAIPHHMFVDRPHFIEDGKLKILFIGRIVREKGVRELLYAVYEMRERMRCEDIELRIIGPDYGYLRTVQRILNELNLNDVVRILGTVSEEEKIKNLDWCDVLVLPSYYEAFGIPLLEAMARGKPVIATKTVGSMSLIKHGETGFLVEIGDWNGIAHWLLYLHVNPELKYRMGQKALEHARCFSMEKMIERHIELYRKLT